MKLRGFTIVELLIVIVVIAILAAISIVAFNGVQDRARASSASSAASQAKKQLELYKIENGETYPTTGNLAAAGVADEGSITYEYTSDGTSFCITATDTNKSYRATNTTGPTTGGCAGHGQGGVAAVTNLVYTPKSTLFSPIVSGVSHTNGVSWNGKNYWNRYVYNGSGATTTRYNLNLSDLEDGQVYTISVNIGNSGSMPFNFTMDFCDQGGGSYVVNPGEEKRITFSASRSDYTSTFRFVDMNPNSTNTDGILASELMVTKGATTYGYADGDSTDWVWNGTPNNSTSTGPAL